MVITSAARHVPGVSEAGNVYNSAGGLRAVQTVYPYMRKMISADHNLRAINCSDGYN